MTRLPRLSPATARAIFADVHSLAGDPSWLERELRQRGYSVSACAGGFLAVPAGLNPDVLVLAPLDERAAPTFSGPFILGPGVARIGAVVAALRAATPSTGFLFPAFPVSDADVLPGRVILSLEGGFTPRIWPGCFGSLDVLIRCIGRPPQRDSPNLAVNAIEAAIPILAALQAAASFPPGRRRSSGSPDAPLMPRLSVVAAHGGTRGSSPPTLFDIIVTRRYGPDETAGAVTAEIEAVLRAAAGAAIRVDTTVLGHTAPVDDPTRPRWSREAEAVAHGWNWPQSPFRTRPSYVTRSTPFGGLEEPGFDPADPAAMVSVEEIGALSSSLSRYLSDH